MGCGYQWQTIPHTVLIPYIIGDSDGALTNELVRVLSLSGIGTFCQSGAQYRLQVTILRRENQTIGYRRDRQQVSGENQKNLIAAEARKTVVVEAALYDEVTGKVIRGPCQVDANVDYDYVDGDSIQDLVFVGPNGISQVVLPFSLGQLESIDAAQEAASRPLNVRIAKKIIDAIFCGW